MLEALGLSTSEAKALIDECDPAGQTHLQYKGFLDFIFGPGSSGLNDLKEKPLTNGETALDVKKTTVEVLSQVLDTAETIEKKKSPDGDSAAKDISNSHKPELDQIP